MNTISDSKEIDALLDAEYQNFKENRHKNLRETFVGSGHKRQNKENIHCNRSP